ncbi:serine/threonine protein kinase, putative, partial [Hepatocystis sp. ex Piliocolobus tephrosceles]
AHEKVFTLFNYDYIQCISNVKNVYKTNEAEKNKNIKYAQKELVCSDTAYNRTCKNKNKLENDKLGYDQISENQTTSNLEELLKIDAKEELPKNISITPMNIINEYTLYTNKYKDINLVLIKKYNNKKKKYVLKKKIKKVYKCVKDEMYHPYVGDYISWEKIIKLEKLLTEKLKHKNIINMQCYIYKNDKILSFYNYGGKALMKWDDKNNNFQLPNIWIKNNNSIYEKQVEKKKIKKKESIIHDTSISICSPMTDTGKKNNKNNYRKNSCTKNSYSKNNFGKKKKKSANVFYVYPEYLIADMLRQLIQICFYLYKNNIYHSDIKPSNIVVKNIKKKNLNKISFCEKNKKWYIKKYGKIIKKKIFIKLIDFEFVQKHYQGIANVGGTTSLFKSLEEFKNSKINIFPKTVWVIGITLFILATAVHPFTSITNDVHIYFIFQNNNLNIQEKIKNYTYLSDSFKDLLQKMLIVNYKKRIPFNELVLHPYVLFG